MKTYHLGKVAGLEIGLTLSAVWASLLLWLALSAIAFWLLRLPPGQAILGGLLAVLLHWLSEFVHQLGHAWAARRVGHPMRGVRLWWLLGASRYPRNEGPLPAAVHIRRALGGPPASLILTLIGAALLFAWRDNAGLPYWLALFFCLENLLVFTLGAFLPLGFTDGSTLLEWWPKR
jgi:hypothetical protein